MKKVFIQLRLLLAVYLLYWGWRIAIRFASAPTIQANEKFRALLMRDLRMRDLPGWTP